MSDGMRGAYGPCRLYCQCIECRAFPEDVRKDFASQSVEQLEYRRSVAHLNYNYYMRQAEEDRLFMEYVRIELKRRGGE